MADDKKLSRRGFLKAAGLGGVGAAVTNTVGSAQSLDSEYEEKNLSGSPANQSYRRLADPIENILSAPDGSISFDYLIIGSGYGGSITAANLAAAFPGLSIAVFERGKEMAPGEYPQTLFAGTREFRKKDNPLGLLNYHFNKEVDVFVGNGLGGTSLINANVAIHPDDDIFTAKNWPKAIVDDHLSGNLDQYYERVRRMIDVQKYNLPDPIHKIEVLEKEAGANGGGYELLDLAVNFKESGQKNKAGVVMHRCELCGDCMTGCNWGAKSSTNFNYLPVAKNAGAKIYTQVEVGSVAALSGDGNSGYEIEFTYYPIHKSEKQKKTRRVAAKNVIVAAGSLGSTEILLRSEKKGLALSPRLGKGFSANGNSLGMAYNGQSRTNILGFGVNEDKVPENYKVGPTILASADYRFEGSAEDKKLKSDLYQRFVVEDGSIASPLVGLVSTFAILEAFPTTFKQFLRSIIDVVKRRSPSGALNFSMVYLGCGHDQAQGELFLDEAGSVKVSWPDIKKKDPIFNMITSKMKDHAKSDKAHFTGLNPREQKVLGDKITTVHPLGGCAMGEDISTGVVNHKGQVFNPDGGVYEGLYVCDGAIIPSAVGVNPFLTISAMAERISDFMTNKRQDG